MNSSNIEDINIEKIRSHYYESSIHNADKYWIYEHYRVGEKPDTYKSISNFIYSDILCTDDCELINYINKKLTDISDECDKKKHFCEKIKKYSEKNNCPEEEACDNIINPKW